MKKSWHKKDPPMLSKLKEEIQHEFPLLRVVERDGKIVVVGGFPVTHNGRELGCFSMEITLHDDHPNMPPVVNEVGGKIEQKLDNHIINGQACLMMHDEYWLNDYHKKPFIEFLKIPVRNFLLFHLGKEAGIKWKHGEYSHGAQGIFEFYEKLFATSDLMTILNNLEILATRPLKGHWQCLCGSGQRVRKCHPAILKTRYEVPQHVLKDNLSKLQKSCLRASKIATMLQRAVDGQDVSKTELRSPGPTPPPPPIQKE